MALKRFIYIFTYLGALFLMSHIISNNVSAIQYNLSLDNYDLRQTQLRSNVDCNTNYGQSTSQSFCVLQYNANVSPVSLNKIQTTSTFLLKSNDVVVFDLVMFSSLGFSFDDGVISGLSYLSLDTDNVVLYDVRDVTDLVLPSVFSSGTGQISSGNFFYKVIELTYKVVSDTPSGVHIGIQGNNTFPVFVANFTSSVDSISFKIVNLKIFGQVGDGGSKDQQNEINATNDAVQDSEDAGSDSSTDAQQGTASLISTIGGAVTAISSASPTNCRIDADMGNFDMGEIDLCANPVPSFVQIITSLLLILITVPLCIVLFNRFIGLFRSFQG